MTPKEYIEKKQEAALLVKHHSLPLLDYYLYAPDGKHNFSVMCTDVAPHYIKCLMLYPQQFCSLYEVFYFDYKKNIITDLNFFIMQKVDAAFARISFARINHKDIGNLTTQNNNV